ncbi:single-stranded DNA-binding protein [Candidatus Curtissbacteria bacterium]|nr:single-stranded DNA-binding protein [Candidatus Curtissbacteria bacterium]
MASRASLNKVLLIGNLTRDPELRYTPSGAAVCTFGVATNRTYTSSDGTKKEETEFIRIVSWNKLAELCSQLLTKGRKVYVEGRLQTRSWETPDGQTRQTTEIVIDDMRILDSRKSFEEGGGGRESQYAPVTPEPKTEEKTEEVPSEKPAKKSPKDVVKQVSDKGEKQESSDERGEEQKVDLDDLPF